MNLAESPLRSYEKEALAFLRPLSADYPEIETWYFEKVVPGLRNNTRIILPFYRMDQLVGLGIAKNDGVERKICTVRVSPSYEGRGLGVRIFDGLLKWLDTDRPNLTVSQRSLPKFHRLFDYYGFRETSSNLGVYLPHSWEHGFNEFQPVDFNFVSRSDEKSR